MLGAGAIGGLFAAKLAQDPRLDVSIAVRRPTRGLTLEIDGSVREAPVRVVTEATSLPPVDWVVVATKAHDVAGLGDWLGAPALSGARVAVAQNGVEHVERLAPWVAAELVLPVIVTYGAERPAPGRVVQTLAGRARVPGGELGRRFADLCGSVDLEVEPVDDFVSALWTKLAWNLVGNSLTTILDLPVREIGLRPELQWLGSRLIAECRAVAVTRGATLAEGLTEEMLGTFAAYPPTVRSSMWQDRDAGRPLEHEAISGAVARIGASAGVEVPYSEMATHLLRTISSRGLAESRAGSPYEE